MPPLAPGAIAGLVLAILALLSIVSAACIVLHRRRKAINSNMPIFHPSTPDLEKAGTRYSPSLSGFSNKKLRKNRRKAPPVLPADLDHDIFSPACVVLAGGSGAAFAIAAGNGVNPSCSTLNVDISPSLPRVFKVKTEGGTTFGMEKGLTSATLFARACIDKRTSSSRARGDVKLVRWERFLLTTRRSRRRVHRCEQRMVNEFGERNVAFMVSSSQSLRRGESLSVSTRGHAADIASAMSSSISIAKCQATGEDRKAGGVRLSLTEAMGRLCTLVRAQLVCAQHADAATGAVDSDASISGR
ncbi:predicted protein [Postia placenta Mad-698-R]|nr:predicted protein [Postia placenta Mad-698-R]